MTELVVAAGGKLHFQLVVHILGTRDPIRDFTDLALFLFSRGIKPVDVVNLEPGARDQSGLRPRLVALIAVAAATIPAGPPPMIAILIFSVIYFLYGIYCGIKDLSPRFTVR